MERMWGTVGLPVTVITLLLLAVSAFSLSFIGKRFVRELRDRHRAKWEQLGKPDFRFSSSIGGYRAMYRLVRSADIADLDDAGVRHWQKMTRIAMYAYFLSAFLFLLNWGIAMGRSFTR